MNNVIATFQNVAGDIKTVAPPGWFSSYCDRINIYVCERSTAKRTMYRVDG